MKKIIVVTIVCLSGVVYLFISGKYSEEDYIFFIILLLMFPPALKAYLDYKELNSREHNFPIFVRDLTLNIKTGMEPVKSIILLKDNDYGALSRDIKLLSSNLSLGVSIKQALKIMADNTKSKRIKRAISIISGSIKAGGRIDDTLTILSAHLINEREMKSEIDSRLFTYQLIFYIIYIIFIAMEYFLLNNILPMMNKSGFYVDINFYRVLMLKSTLLLGFCMGITGGKLTKGSVAAGFPNVLIMLVIGYVLHKTIV